MAAIVLRPDLLDALEKHADLEATSLDDLVNEAVARYVRDLQHDKLEQEIEAYRRLHGELQRQHLGQWVAVHRGQVVDHDGDRAELHRRVRDRYGKTVVLIRRVSEEPEEEIRWRGGSVRLSVR